MHVVERVVAAAARAAVRRMNVAVRWSPRARVLLARDDAGGCVLAATHHSHLDAIVLGACVPRRVHWLADEWLFRVPVLGAMLRRMGVLRASVASPGAPGAVRRSVRLVRDGGAALCVFPEGERASCERPDVGPLASGAALVAVLAERPVVPVLVRGTFAVWPRQRALPRLRALATQRIECVFGDPIEPPRAVPTEDDDDDDGGGGDRRAPRSARARSRADALTVAIRTTLSGMARDIDAR